MVGNVHACTYAVTMMISNYQAVKAIKLPRCSCLFCGLCKHRLLIAICCIILMWDMGYFLDYLSRDEFTLHLLCVFLPTYTVTAVCYKVIPLHIRRGIFASVKPYDYFHLPWLLHSEISAGLDWVPAAISLWSNPVNHHNIIGCLLYVGTFFLRAWDLINSIQWSKYFYNKAQSGKTRHTQHSSLS